MTTPGDTRTLLQRQMDALQVALQSGASGDMQTSMYDPDTDGVLAPGAIPDLDAARIASGTLADERVSSNLARTADLDRFNHLDNASFRLYSRSRNHVMSSLSDMSRAYDRWIVVGSDTDSFAVRRGNRFEGYPVKYPIRVMRTLTPTGQVGIFQYIDRVDALAGQTVTLSGFVEAYGDTATIYVTLLSSGVSTIADPVLTWGSPMTYHNDYTELATSPGVTLGKYEDGQYIHVTTTVPQGCRRLAALFYTDLVPTNAGLELSHPQLERGAQRTPYSRRSFSVEQAICEEYIESFVSVGTNDPIAVGFVSDPKRIDFPLLFRSRKEQTPTIETTGEWQVKGINGIGTSLVIAPVTLMVSEITQHQCVITADVSTSDNFFVGSAGILSRRAGANSDIDSIIIADREL